MRTFHFHQEPHNHNAWYVDLPEYVGPREDLEMVYGASTFLDMISEGTGKASVCVSSTYFEGSDQLVLLTDQATMPSGAIYLLETFRGIDIHHELFLCEVMLFVFGQYPEQLFISVVNE